MGYKDIPIVELELEEYLKKKLLANDIKTFGKLLDLYVSNELLFLPGLGQVKYNKIASFIEGFIRSGKVVSEAKEYEDTYNKELIFKKDLPVEKYPFSERVKNRVKTMEITYISEIEDVIYKSKVKGIGKASKDELLEAYEWQKKNHSKYFDKEVIPEAIRIRGVVLDSLKFAFSKELNEDQWHDVSCYLLYKICQRFEDKVTMEIDDLINDCLNDWEVLVHHIKNVFNENSFKAISSEDVLQYFNNLISKEAVDNCLAKMCDEGIIEKVENEYQLILHSFFEIYGYVKKTSNIDKKEVIRLRLEEGLTLEEVGQKYGLTRERIRQIICKEKNTFLEIIEAQTGQTCLLEDRYAYMFSMYSISKDDFIEIFDIANKEYYYLESIYSKGDEKLVSALYDDEISQSVKRKILKCIQKEAILLDGELVHAKKNELVDFVIKRYCRSHVDMDQFVEIYNQVLNNNKIENESLYILDEHYVRTLKNKISMNDTCLSSGKTFRFYDIHLYDYSELLETIDLLSYDGLMISTKKFMEEYPYLMEMYDIQNEYELHNLLKKILCNNEEYSDLKFTRMPHIIVGEFELEDYLNQKVFEYSPITSDELVDIIHNETGIDQLLIKTYLVQVNRFYSRGVYEVPYDILDSHSILKLKEVMTEDLYTIEEFYSLYEKCLPGYNKKYITGYLYNQLDYRLCSGYIIKKTLQAEEYFKNLLRKDNFYDITKIRKKYAYIQVFYESLSQLIKDYEIVELEPNVFYRIEEVENKGWDKEKIINFVEKILQFINDGEFFNLDSLKYRGFEIEESMSQTFYTGIIKANSQTSFIKLQNKTVICKNKKNITTTMFIEYLIDKYERVSFEELYQILVNEYGVVADKYKLNQIINNSHKYYDAIEKVIYKDYLTYQNYN